MWKDTAESGEDLPPAGGAGGTAKAGVRGVAGSPGCDAGPSPPAALPGARAGLEVDCL